MANQKQLLDLKPYESSDVPKSNEVVPQDEPDTLQLKVDIINVIEGRVAIESFPIEYQEKMKNYYRFYGQRSSPKYPFYPKMIRSTLDIV